MVHPRAEIGPAQLSLFDDEAATASPSDSGAIVAAATFSPAAPARPPATGRVGDAAPTSGAAPAAPAAPTGLAAAPAPARETTPLSLFRHPRAQRELVLAGHTVAYALRRVSRRSIGFVVGPEGLNVSAPRWVGVGEIESALRAKTVWIVRKLQEQAERARRMQAARIDWRDGAHLPYLGESVILVLDPRCSGAVLHTDADALPGVPRLTLHLGLPQHAGQAQVRELVQSWLQRQARRVFTERCNHFAPRLGVQVRRIGLSSATTRWGSASADGSIRLHWRLVHFALPVIDYVVTHELAHLREMNHSPAFWDVVRSALPDYEQAMGTLRQQVLPALD